MMYQIRTRRTITMAKNSKVKTQAIEWSPFSLKGMQSIKYADAFINIYEGAVRSSKTVCSTIAWIKFLEESPHQYFLMTGKTEDTCYRNMIGGATGMIAIMGADNCQYKKSGDGGTVVECRFPDKKNGKWIYKWCYVVGANDAQSEQKIRGMTVAGWLADEVTLYPESMVKQAINRMSLDGAKAFWTCNPDSPYHYIMTEFIEMAKEKGYRVFHFSLDDNKALSTRYKDQLKKAYKGLWYKRMVLGQWVMADGVIYNNFNTDLEKDGGMVITEKPRVISKYNVAVDYGNSNATTFLLIGFINGKEYVLDEYYHSGKDGKGKSPSQYAKDLLAFIDRNDHNGSSIAAKLDKIIIDPSAKGFILEFYNVAPKHIRGKITPARNDVVFGIEITTSLIDNNVVRVHKSCENFLREISTYCWDENAQKKGKDQPIKDNDHTMDAFRYNNVVTRKYWERILNTNFDNRRRGEKSDERE